MSDLIHNISVGPGDYRPANGEGYKLQRGQKYSFVLNKAQQTFTIAKVEDPPVVITDDMTHDIIYKGA